MNEYISDHIKKYGNTNFITDAGLKSGSQIFAIGDSHCIYFYNSMKIKEHWFFNCGLPLTIYKFIKSDLDIYNIGNILKNGHEKYNIKENDYVIFLFGYNDIQRNIYQHSRDKWSDEIDSLIKNYIDTIIILKNKYKIIPIVPCIYPLPREDAQGINIKGSFNERHNYTLYANEKLKQHCEINNLKFLDIYCTITDEFGYIKKEYTSDNIHLDYNNVSLRDIIENEIYKLTSV